MNFVQWDIELFEFVNTSMSNVIFDILLPWVREPLFWMPLYIFIFAFVFFNFGRKAYWFVIFFILTVSTSDLISSKPIKKTIKRIRPCNTEYIHVIERVECGSGYSFTSTHASNHFAMASFLVLTLGRYFRKINAWCWLWASFVGLAQVYVGVHFPMDILGGALLGIVIGKIWALLFSKYYGHTLKEPVII
jgi:membrane-associated phospholipid phosphatase